MKYLENYWPDRENAEWGRDYSSQQGSQHLHSLFERLREAGFYPFRLYLWLTEEWYISENSMPPVLLLTEDEAEHITYEELEEYFLRWKAEWTFIPKGTEGRDSWIGKWVRSEDIV